MNRRILLVSALGVAPALAVLALGATFGAAVITFRALDAVTEAKRAVLEKDAEAIIANIDERERDVHALTIPNRKTDRSRSCPNRATTSRSPTRDSTLCSRLCLIDKELA